MHLGFIGLGHLGKAVAGRLLDCGHSLSVWNRSAGKTMGMEVKESSSPAALADEVDIIFLCLFDSAAVHEVLQSDEGLLSTDVSGKVIVDLTTNHFKEVETFHALCRAKEAIYLETPVLGSVIPASQGALTVLVSGEESGYEKVREILQDIGKHVFYLAEATVATKMKLINNLTLGSFMATIAEALSLGENIGLPKEDILEILSVGGGNSLVLNAKKQKLQNEDFSTHFSSSLIYKDLHYLQDLAYSLKRPLFTGALVKELYAKTFNQSIAEEDFSAIYKVFKNG